MADNNFLLDVIGDLTEKEAKEFFLGDGEKGTWAGIINDPSDPKPVPPGAEEHWPAIYERCGGNIGMLKVLVKAARSGNWDSALENMVARPRATIANAFRPSLLMHRNEPPLWTPDQWKLVLEKITTAPHHAVLRDELVKVLGNGDEQRGDEIFLSLAKYNLLALRPYSTLARDLPPEVFGDRKEEVVTLASAAHLFAAKKELLERKRAAK